ncbi:FMRFamide receptor [Photinus pyralis]|uniref:FMRFamide receptor n=1 Tax=Photinus pyralis TaxID=7054 RepID=UPI0012672F56|nr:FMRFamide receptor [Photinus pyralis]
MRNSSLNDVVSTPSPWTIGENDSCILVPDSSMDCYTFIINGIFLNGIGLLGILGNIISMIILSRPQMKSSINYLLIGLARVDTVLIITSVLLFGLSGIYPYTGQLFTYYYVVYPHIVPVIYPLSMATQTASAYLTLTVTLERFVAVCHPLRARSLCTYGRARVYVVVIIIFSFVYNFPKVFEASIKSEWYEDANLTVYCIRPTEFRSNDVYVNVYVHWCYLIFMYVVPFGSLAVLNAAIYKQVRKANMERQRLSRLQRREIGLATMLLFVVLVFFICNLLPLVNNIIESFHFQLVRKANMERQRLSRLQRREIGLATMLLFVVLVFFICNLLPLVNNIIESFHFQLDQITKVHIIKTSNLFVTINSSVNFIIYVIFGEKFQRLFLRLFCSHGFFSSSTGRDSPDGATTNEDSFISNGDRQSMRLYRQSTTISRNGTSIRLNGTDRRSLRTRVPSPGPCVYYPANRRKKENNYMIQTSIPSTEWEETNCNSATNF